ncbi:MAG: hypothetical protein J2P31_04410, partial [Blastocatellia bacterium]|nr:hypothetical protein [Blastocatellia bacterium]
SVTSLLGEADAGRTLYLQDSGKIVKFINGELEQFDDFHAFTVGSVALALDTFQHIPLLPMMPGERLVKGQAETDILNPSRTLVDGLEGLLTSGPSRSFSSRKESGAIVSANPALALGVCFSTRFSQLTRRTDTDRHYRSDKQNYREVFQG